MLQHAAIVIQTEQQRAHRVFSALVPAEARNDAISCARVLDFDHRALARLIRDVRRLGDDAVETGAFEARQPFAARSLRSRVIGVRWTGGSTSCKRCSKQRATLALRLQASHCRPSIASTIERDKRRRRFLRQLGDARRCRMQPQLKRIEVEAARLDDDDLAVDHATARQLFEQRIVQLRKIAVERPQVAALNEHVGRAAKDDRAKSVPLRLEQKSSAQLGSSSASLASIGSIGGAIANAGYPGCEAWSGLFASGVPDGGLRLAIRIFGSLLTGRDCLTPRLAN